MQVGILAAAAVSIVCNMASTSVCECMILLAKQTFVSICRAGLEGACRVNSHMCSIGSPSSQTTFERLLLTTSIESDTRLTRVPTRVSEVRAQRYTCP